MKGDRENLGILPGTRLLDSLTGIQHLITNSFKSVLFYRYFCFNSTKKKAKHSVVLTTLSQNIFVLLEKWFKNGFKGITWRLLQICQIRSLENSVIIFYFFASRLELGRYRIYIWRNVLNFDLACTLFQNISQWGEIKLGLLNQIANVTLKQCKCFAPCSVFPRQKI